MMNVSKLFVGTATRVVITAAWASLMLGTFAGTARADVAPSYRLHGGDVLNVVVYGEQTPTGPTGAQTLSGPLTVLPDGTIAMPLVGSIHVAGQTPEEAAQSIKVALRKYLRHPVVSVAVTTVGQVNVLVLGDVKTPGKYLLPPTGSLTDAIAAAGGVNPVEGAYPEARIAMHGIGVSVSLEKLLHQGDASLNVPLEDGAIVYIPAPQIISIRVVGSVDHPGEVDLNEGDRLSMAIAKAGNTANASADLNNISVTRTSPDGTSTVMHVNLYKTLEGGDVSKDLVMEKGDLVYVPQAKKGGIGSVVAQSMFWLINSFKLLGF